MNLVVAKGIPCFADLDVGHYVRLADQWASDIRQRLAGAEAQFHRSPADWKNDIRFFRLGIVCWYMDEVLGITYPDELANAEDRLYADPMDVFLNGLMDRRRGSCASMPALHVALGWRLGWPVSLACANNHLFCRFDDGEVTHNIEATAFGRGGFRSHPDDYYRQQYRIPEIAVSCGSDLRAVTAAGNAGAVHRDSRDALCERAARCARRKADCSWPDSSSRRIGFCTVRRWRRASNAACGCSIPAKAAIPPTSAESCGSTVARSLENTCTTITTETKHANDHDALRNQRIATRC